MIVEEIFLAAFELKLDLYTPCIRAHVHLPTLVSRTCVHMNVLKLSATSNEVTSLLKRFTESDTASKNRLQEISITTPTYE